MYIYIINGRVLRRYKIIERCLLSLPNERLNITMLFVLMHRDMVQREAFNTIEPNYPDDFSHKVLEPHSVQRTSKSA